MPLWRWVKELKLSWSRGLPQKLPRRSHSCGAAPVPAAPHNSCPVPRAAALPVHNPSTVRGWPSPHNARIHGHGNALRPHASGAADPSHCNTESALGLSAVSVGFFSFFFFPSFILLIHLLDQASSKEREGQWHSSTASLKPAVMNPLWMGSEMSHVAVLQSSREIPTGTQ